MTPDPTTRDPAASLERCIELVRQYDAGSDQFVLDNGASVNDSAMDFLRDDATALLAEVEALRLRAAELERQRDDYLSREWQATKAKSAAEQVAREAVALLVDCNTVANVRGQLGVADCIDNDGQPYQSQHLADFLAHHGARTGDSNAD